MRHFKCQTFASPYCCFSSSLSPCSFHPHLNSIENPEQKRTSIDTSIFNFTFFSSHRCKLSGISVDLFSSLTNLVEVDLSGNYLTNVPTEALKNIPHLRKLSLAHNLLNRLPDHSFGASLQSLDLTNCSLKSIDPFALSSLTSLQVLHLALNNLISVSGEAIESLGNLKELTLHANPWHCDCSLRPLRAFMIQKNIPLSYSSYCHSPDRLKNFSWSNLTLDEFACKPIIISSLASPSSYSYTVHGKSDPSTSGFNYSNKKYSHSSSKSTMNSIYTNANNNGRVVDSDNSFDSDNDDDEDTNAEVDSLGEFTLKDKVQVVEGKNVFRFSHSLRMRG